MHKTLPIASRCPLRAHHSQVKVATHQVQLYTGCLVRDRMCELVASRSWNSFPQSLCIILRYESLMNEGSAFSVAPNEMTFNVSLKLMPAHYAVILDLIWKEKIRKLLLHSIFLLLTCLIGTETRIAPGASGCEL